MDPNNFNFQDFTQEQNIDFGQNQDFAQFQENSQTTQEDNKADPSNFIQDNKILQASAGLEGLNNNLEFFGQNNEIQPSNLDTNAIFGETINPGTVVPEYLEGNTFTNTTNVVDENTFAGDGNAFMTNLNTQTQETNIEPNAFFSGANIDTNAIFGQTQDIQGETQIIPGTEANAFIGTTQEVVQNQNQIDFGQIPPQQEGVQNIYGPYQASGTNDINSLGYGTTEMQPGAQPQPIPLFQQTGVPITQTTQTTTTKTVVTQPTINQIQTQHIGEQLDYEAYPATNAPVRHTEEQNKAPVTMTTNEIPLVETQYIPNFDIAQFQNSLESTPLATSEDYTPVQTQVIPPPQEIPPPEPKVIATPQPIVQATYIPEPKPVVQTAATISIPPKPIIQTPPPEPVVVQTPPPQTTIIQTPPPKPVVQAPPPKPVVIQTPPPKPVVQVPPPQPVVQTTYKQIQIPQTQTQIQTTQTAYPVSNVQTSTLVTPSPIQIVPQPQIMQNPYILQNQLIQNNPYAGYRINAGLVDEDFRRGRPIYKEIGVPSTKLKYQNTQLNTSNVRNIVGLNNNKIGMSRLAPASSYTTSKIVTPQLNPLNPELKVPTINTNIGDNLNNKINTINTNIENNVNNVVGNINTVGNNVNNAVNNINTVGDTLNNVSNSINNGLDKLGKSSSYNVGPQSITPILNQVGLGQANVAPDNTRLIQLKDFI